MKQTKRLKQFKYMLLLSLLAVVLLLVGFCIIETKSDATVMTARASRNDLVGGTLIYNYPVDSFTYYLDTPMPNVKLDMIMLHYYEGEVSSVNELTNLGSNITLRGEMIGLETFTFTLTDLDLKLFTNYAICLFFRPTDGEEQGIWYSNILKFNLVPTETAPLPAEPAKEGHIFIGWFTDEACTIPYYEDVIINNITLYAGWQIITYKVTLIVENGTTPTKTVTVDWNTPVPLPEVERIGHDFIGWYANGVEYIDAPITADITLVAIWELKVFTVTFMVDGVEYKSFQVNYGTTLKQALVEAKLINFSLASIPDNVDIETLSVSADTFVAIAPKDTLQIAIDNWKILLIILCSVILALSISVGVIVGAVKKKRG